MSSIISEKAVKQAELNSTRVKRGEDLKLGREKIILEDELVEQLLQEPIVVAKQDMANRRTYITGMSLIPMNLDDVIDGITDPTIKTPKLHLELVEHSQMITDKTLIELGSKADRFLKHKLEELKWRFTLMDEQQWRGYKEWVGKAECNVYRSKVAVELKEEYGIKNL